jgi:Ca-activated chloride channel family protein
MTNDVVVVIGYVLIIIGLARSPLLKDKVAWAGRAALAWLVKGLRGAFTTAQHHPRLTVTALVPLFAFGAFGWAYASGGLCQSSLRLNCPKEDDGPPPCPAAPVPGVVEICFYSSNTKEDWVDNVTAAFNAAKHTIASGETISVTVFHVSSGSSKDDILNHVISPTVWSPGDQSWVDEANRVSEDRTGQPLVRGGACPPAVISPIGFAMWRPMAETLGWPDAPITWETLVQLSADPQGWGRYGHPEWGSFKFGHTHPGISNSGKLIMVMLAYDTLGVTEDLTHAQVKSEAMVNAMAQVEAHTYHYGQQSRDLLALMVRRGPDYLHATNTTEAETLKTNLENADKLKYPLAFIIPAHGTFWTEQPYCILDTDWVSAEQREAAEMYREYLLAPEQQALAVDNYLRPVDSTISLRCPLCLTNGVDPRVTPLTVPALQSPSAEASGAIQDVFQATKKKATIVIVLDTSGSMQGEMMTNAIAATTNFLRSLNKDDEVYVIHFGDTVTDLGGGRAGDVAETLSQQLSGLEATGKTALYDAVCAGTDRLAQAKTAHETAGDPARLYGLVLLSDGEDTSSRRSKQFMEFCLPRGEVAGEARVYTIAYGDLADTALLADIAKRTNGRAFTGDPTTIETVYIAISAEQ